MKINNITNNNYSDEWYTDQNTVDLMYHLFRDYTKGVGMFPFDTEKSKFVSTCNGEKIHSIQDFLESDYEYDFIITNPPFSIKDKVIEKCVKDAKPTCLILPLDSLGGGKKTLLI
jgi:hypothetical protein